MQSELNMPAEPAGFKERLVSELKKFALISAYLWLLFLVFELYKRELLHENGISAWKQGWAIVNALVFGKVILIAQALEVGKQLEKRALLWIVLGKSVIFGILLIAFHVAEEALRVWIKSEPTSLIWATFGDSLFGLATYTGIFAVALIPFFAFQELDRILGDGLLWELFLHGDTK
jgi:hypothetical protein